MATRIRLRRVGRRNQPEYRIVVAHQPDARDGAFVDAIGHYNPRTTPETLTVDADKAREWLSRGATPSDTVRSLLKRAGVFAEAETAPAGAVVAEVSAPDPVIAEAPAPDAPPSDE